MDDLKQAGILKFEFLGEPEIMEVHVFTTDQFKGTPTESEGKNIGILTHLNFCRRFTFSSAFNKTRACHSQGRCSVLISGYNSLIQCIVILHWIEK